MLGEKHAELLTAKNDLAAALGGQCKYEQSEKLYREALTERREVLGEEHPDTFSSKNHLAIFLKSQGKYEESERLSRETLAQGSSLRYAINAPTTPTTVEEAMDCRNINVLRQLLRSRRSWRIFLVR